MNTDLMLEIADMIEQYPYHFFMGGWWGSHEMTGTPAECGTTACISGHALALTGVRAHSERDMLGFPTGCLLHDDSGEPVDFMTEGAQALGLTRIQAEVMFTHWVHLKRATIVARLRDIAKGELVWSDEERYFAPNPDSKEAPCP